MKKGTAATKAVTKPAPLEPEVLAPRQPNEIDGNTINHGLKAARELQACMMGHVIGFAQCRIGYGIELLKLKEAVRLKGMNWGQWYKLNLAAPKFDYRSARMYMEVGRAWLRRASGVLNTAPVLLRAPPSSMTDAQRDEFLQAVSAVTTAQTWQQLQFDLGLAPAPAPSPVLGGNAGLLHWLKEQHPECKARKADDLPADLKAEWDAMQAKGRAELRQSANEARCRLFQKALDKLHTMIREEFHVALPRPQLEHSAALLGDIREALLERMRQ